MESVVLLSVEMTSSEPEIQSIETVSISKIPYARFDLNDYSVPHDQVRKSLTIHATLESVTILDGVNIKACHSRS